MLGSVLFTSLLRPGRWSYPFIPCPSLLPLPLRKLSPTSKYSLTVEADLAIKISHYCNTHDLFIFFCHLILPPGHTSRVWRERTNFLHFRENAFLLKWSLEQIPLEPFQGTQKVPKYERRHGIGLLRSLVPLWTNDYKRNANKHC